MTKTAIVHSLHSQVAGTLWALDREFDLIVSMDSHLDTSLAGDADVYPKELEVYMRRTGIHMAFREMFGGIPFVRKKVETEEAAQVIIAISESMFAKHALDINELLTVAVPEARNSLDKNPLEYYADFLARYFGVGIYLSPPNSLMGLLPFVRVSDNWLLDIDVDYMQDMQNEAYTSIRNAESGQLQRMTHVLNFIRRAQPELITLSEAKAAAIRNPRSNFSTFLSKLRSGGYRVEEAHILEDDEETLRRIKDCEDFYLTTSKGVLIGNLQRGESLDKMHREEQAKAKEFFRSRGYAV